MTKYETLNTVTSTLALIVSIFVYFNQRRASTVRLKITLGHPEGDEDRPRFAKGGIKLSPALVKIYNDSNFDVTIVETGIRVKEPRLTNVTGVVTANDLTLPQRIPAKTALVVYVTGEEWSIARRNVVAVYATTDAGTEFRMSRFKLTPLQLWYRANKQHNALPVTESGK